MAEESKDRRHRGKAIMVQGTMSGAGKSLLVAGLCRVFAQDGYRVAPFKSQNMSLNSAVTPEGLEIGRAQALQACACGIPVQAAMNPILLKPTTDVGSQVIVMGKPLDNMSARDYFRFKKTLVPCVQQAFDSLADSFDIVVIEGAGSPAEINLKSCDIVNMGMAKMAAAPVLLVGNIDCGGVFAQLVGTQALLDPDELPYLKACVINKFRGDVSLLQPGLDELERRMGVPVAGVVPWCDLDLDDEDGFSAMQGKGRPGALIDITVVRLPHISNFTDFDALADVAQVSLRFVRQADELGRPDLVIVPGSKATLADLAWMREAGFDEALRTFAQLGGLVMGICGGYQMLGLSVSDPEGMEGGGQAAGLGLLPVHTVFAGEKTLTRCGGVVCTLSEEFEALSHLPVSGYQIHMGQSRLVGGAPFALLGEERTPDGCVNHNVCGTYLHGLFDTPALTQALVDSLLARKGLTDVRITVQDRNVRRNEQLDRLADILRASLDMDLVYRILEEGI